jgi:hypothetical protein
MMDQKPTGIPEELAGEATGAPPNEVLPEELRPVVDKTEPALSAPPMKKKKRKAWTYWVGLPTGNAL